MIKEPWTSAGLLVLRVSTGVMMIAAHGWPKLAGYAEKAEVFPDPIGLGSQMSLIAAIGTEAGCSLLLILGLFTRLAALPLAFTMGVALFIVHGSDPWKVKELAAVYLAVYVSLALLGGGRFSLDAKLFGGKGRNGGEAG